MELTAGQAQHVERARAVLTDPPAHEPAGMTDRIGRLEWHLGELLALIGELAGQERPA